MRKVVISFDDGRIDNYLYVFPILCKYGLKATFFVTTGYVDGSFCPTTWRSSEGPMTVENLRHIQECGNEIALHGDCHKTEQKDFETCYEKISQWLGGAEKYGFSIPGSHYSQELLGQFVKDEQSKLLYVRGGSLGRGRNGVFRRILKGFRVYTNWKHYFFLYNRNNFLSDSTDLQVIPSIGIRIKDKEEKVQYLLEKMPDEHSVILMFHSILPGDSSKYGQDSWCWRRLDA